MDLESEIRSAVRSAVGASCGDEDALSIDSMDTLACLACDAISDGRGSAAKTDLETAIEEAGVEGEKVRAAILASLLELARAGSDSASLQNGSTLADFAQKHVSDTELSAKKVWKRRGDIEKIRVADYMADWRNHYAHAKGEEEAREKKFAVYLAGTSGATPAANQDAGSGKDGGPASSDTEESETETARIEKEATKSRLRELGRPVTLFGEDDDDRMLRLKQIEIGRDHNELATGSTNVMQLLDRRSEREVPAAIRIGFEAAGSPNADPIVDSDPEMDVDADETGASGDDSTKSVLSWLRTVLHEWEANLKTRSKNQHSLAAFKQEQAQYRQSKQYLKPLRRALRDKAVAVDIVDSLAAIGELCKVRKYKEAKEAYMRLAIGSAAWPMGVTLVSSHDRPNRHNIGEQVAAHVLDDETTRKYVQMVKRLCSFCEVRWPVDPSLAA